MIGAFASFARSQFELSAKQEDGCTLREHLEAVAERSGRQPAALANAPRLPEGLAPLWRDFMELHGCRGSGFGPARITYVDIAAFQHVTGRVFSPWELSAIQGADSEYIAFQAKTKGKAA